MGYRHIRYEKKDHVVTITLNRPEAHAGSFVGKKKPQWKHHGL